MCIHRWLLTLLVVLVSSAEGFSCTCIGELSIRSSIRRADLVCWVKVSRVDTIDVPYAPMGINSGVSFPFKEVFFDVEYLYKGKRRREYSSLMTALGNGGDCGFGFRVGHEYIVYAHYVKRLLADNPLPKPVLYTDVCTRTRVYEDSEVAGILRYRTARRPRYRR